MWLYTLGYERSPLQCDAHHDRPRHQLLPPLRAMLVVAQSRSLGCYQNEVTSSFDKITSRIWRQQELGQQPTTCRCEVRSSCSFSPCPVDLGLTTFLKTAVNNFTFFYYLKYSASGCCISSFLPSHGAGNASQKIQPEESERTTLLQQQLQSRSGAFCR